MKLEDRKKLWKRARPKMKGDSRKWKNSSKKLKVQLTLKMLVIDQNYLKGVT